jgi:hypothetical protein
LGHVLVVLGDGIDGLQSLGAGSVGLVLSDLPSGETRADFDRPPDFARLWPAVWRALRPGGVAVLMASSLRFAAAVLGSQRARFRYDLVWEKSLAVGFLNARHRPLRAHEFLLVFSSGAGTYHPQRTDGHRPISTNGIRGALGSQNYGTGQAVGADGTPLGVARSGATDRYPRSVLAFGSVGIRDRRRTHPQQKPEDLLRWCVRTYSDPGDLVVDPYAGSGSAGRAAEAEGRRFVGWDVSPQFGVDPLS